MDPVILRGDKMRRMYINANQEEKTTFFATLKEAREACKRAKMFYNPTVARAYNIYDRNVFKGYVVTEYSNTCPM